ncbi:MAG: contractile injection system tape measure protein, partial [Bacteroidota bacterium]
QKTEDFRSFPDVQHIISQWRQWHSSLSSNTESRSVLSQLEEFLKSSRKLDEAKTWKMLQMEGKWFLDEARKVTADVATAGKSRSTVHDKLSEGMQAYVSNAGVVILWSFLGRLFGALDWIDEEGFKESMQERAIMLIHFLCTGQTETTEDELLLAKLLVGWPQETPCLVSIDLSKDEQEIASELLSTIISYNPMLGNSTMEAFQGNFLLRDGMLSRLPDNWQLQVEEQPYDLILKKFPWSWQVVKTPWMDQPLMVNWK